MKKSLFRWFAEKGQISKYSSKKSANLSDRNLQSQKWFRTWNYERSFPLCTETIQSEKWFSSAKAIKPYSVLWNRKHIFPCPENMGDCPLRDWKCKVTRHFLKKIKLWATDIWKFLADFAKDTLAM